MAFEKMYTEKEAAVILGISPNTLRTWRCSSRTPEGAPKPTRIGRRVKYQESELKRYIQRRTG